MVDLLEEKSLKSSAVDLNDRLKSLGASVSFYNSSLETGISIRCLKKDLSDVLQIVEERLLNPAFDAEDLERLKKQQVENLKNRKNNAGALASDMVNSTLMEGHRAALPEAGTVKSSSDISRKHILEWYDKIFQPSQTMIAAVGFSNAQELEAELGFLNKLKRQPSENTSSIPKLKFPMRPTLVVVDKPGSAQSEIRWVSPGMPYSALGPHFMSTVAVFPFSGAFNSRLNLNLRENKGYTYGVRGAFQSNLNLGYFQISGSFLHETTDSTLLEIVRELGEYASQGPTEAELEFTRLAMAQRDALNYETPWQRQSILKNILTYQSMVDYPTKQKNMLKGLNLEQMNFHLKRYLDPQSVWIVVVADYAKLKSKLEALDMPIILKKAED
jgi:zinc protease